MSTTTAAGSYAPRPRRAARGPRHAAHPGSPAAAHTWNLLAIIAAVGSVTCTPIGLPVGLAALRQVERTGQRGRGLALFGTVVGTLLLGAYLLLLIQSY